MKIWIKTGVGRIYPNAACSVLFFSDFNFYNDICIQKH